jgi:thiol-disulfide isomerase/thioredoxin
MGFYDKKGLIFMNNINSKEEVENLINNNSMLLIYFGSNNCGVCVDMEPKVEKMLKKYPNIRFIKIDTEKSIKLSTSYNIFTIPAILLFIEGKETIREARHISLQDLDNKISRYYNLLFD